MEFYSTFSKGDIVMKKAIMVLIAGLLLVGSNVLAQDVAIDSSGNLSIGTSNSYGNLKVTGESGEHAVAGETSGTGAAGVYGKSTTSNNIGALGTDVYGVYGNSATGNAGYFEGNARVTGNLTVDGTLSGESDPTVLESVKDGVDWSEITNIPTGFLDDVDNTGGSDIWTQSASDIYFNTGNVGIGTATPAGKLDVSGTLCISGDCRTAWPTGSGTGAFTDTGSVAHYIGGNVGIGTVSPTTLNLTDTRVLHLLQPVGTSDFTATGLRVEIANQAIGGISSAYRKSDGAAGVFVGAISEHRLGFITNSMEKMTLATNGYLGIDTTSPLQPLHVEGNTYISGALGIGVDFPTSSLHVSGSSALLSSGTDDFRVSISKNSAVDTASVLFQDNFTPYAEVGLTADNDFHIKVSPDGVSLTDAITIDNTNGNVGIGTMFPEAKLNAHADDIIAFWAESTGSLWPAIVAKKFSDGDAVYILKYESTGTALHVDNRGTGASFIIRNGTESGNELLVVDNAGNVGIGTATPAGKLDVNGEIYQRGGVLHADYVFEPTYELESIIEHADFMWTNKHLEAIPKAEVDESGREILRVGAHRKGIVEELEKAHIYIEQLQNQIHSQNSLIQTMEKRLTKIEAGQ